MYLVLDLAWSSCLLIFAVLPGEVIERKVDVVSLPSTCQVVGDFCQLGEEPGQDGWEQYKRKVGHDLMCLV